MLFVLLVFVSLRVGGEKVDCWINLSLGVIRKNEVERKVIEDFEGICVK